MPNLPASCNTRFRKCQLGSLRFFQSRMTVKEAFGSTLVLTGSSMSPRPGRQMTGLWRIMWRMPFQATRRMYAVRGCFSLHLPICMSHMLTASALPLGHFVVPIDMRALGGKICCLETRPFMDASDLINTLMQACGRPPAIAIQAAHAQALSLQDPLGQVWEQLPADVSELGWLRLQLDYTRLPADLLAELRPAPGTTSTTTGALPLVSQGPNVVFMLTECGATIWSIPQLISTVNAQQNIQELAQALGLRGTIPELAQLQVTAACPLSRVAGVSTVTLLGHPADGDVHIVYDASTDGSLAHAMTVNPGTMPRDVMMPAQLDRGLIVTVNGVPMTAQHRPLVTGDLVQLIANPDIFTAVPTMHFTREVHRLRFLAFPTRMPRMRRPATAHVPEWQAQTTTGLQLFYEARFLEHREIFGVPDADTTPVYVVGSQHFCFISLSR